MGTPRAPGPGPRPAAAAACAVAGRPLRLPRRLPPGLRALPRRGEGARAARSEPGREEGPREGESERREPGGGGEGAAAKPREGGGKVGSSAPFREGGGERGAPRPPPCLDGAAKLARGSELGTRQPWAGGRGLGGGSCGGGQRPRAPAQHTAAPLTVQASGPRGVPSVVLLGMCAHPRVWLLACTWERVSVFTRVHWGHCTLPWGTDTRT